MKRLRCKHCDHEHDCPGVMGNHERAVKAARARGKLAGVAQTGEQLPRKQQVGGSTPPAGSKDEDKTR